MTFRVLPWAPLAFALAACSSRELPPVLTDDVEGGSNPSDSGIVVPPADACLDARPAPSPDAQGLCGNMFLEITSDPPNLYFVIDRSGSMGEIVEGRQKYDAVAAGAVALVRSLGSEANVGAAVFPGRSVSDDRQCVVGEEVFRALPGDPIGSRACGADGPITRAFSLAISLPSGVRPNGGTPTAATLASLLPTLAALHGRTFVLLATDGGPNCNANAACDAARCIPNIEQQLGCTMGVNCCAPKGAYGPSSCLDDQATKQAVSDLFAKGIKTYVVGIPGSSPYAALLNDLALAGGTARVGAPSSYYDVAHLSELDDVLGSIGATVTSSCHVHLASPPPDSTLVNVYLDGTLVKYGPNGWFWASPDGGMIDATAAPDTGSPETGGATDAEEPTDVADGPATDGESSVDAAETGAPDPGSSHTDIELVGNACEMLTSGKYRRLQVVFGCPTGIVK